MTTGFRPEIQALRALAVLAVVVFHLAPDRLTGGYVGVDVFFVISGFLITDHLLREVESTGSVSLSRFYARRIRRLLPAAFVVLAATAVGVLTLMHTRLWPAVLTEIGASALYVVNWVLAFNAVDYFAVEDEGSPVQHYWSLSVEEQFYLVWPLLVVLVALATRKRPQARRRGLALTFALVFAASFGFSVIVTMLEPQFAYFSTPAHGWEFAIGGLLALAAPRLADSGFPGAQRVRSALSWAGIVAIVVPIFVFTGDTPFPGWIAIIPVLGTIAVMTAGSPDPRWSPRPLMSWRPVQVVGDLSYSIYLWHWPLIVFAPLVVGRELVILDKAVLFLLTLGLAALTRRFVERPVIEGAFWRRRRASYVMVGVTTLVTLAMVVPPLWVLDRRAEAARAEVAAMFEDAESCIGAPALDRNDCAYQLTVNPDIGVDLSHLGAPELDRMTGPTGSRLIAECAPAAYDSEECVSGSPDSDLVVALVGDSHAHSLRPTLDYQATIRDWQIRSYTKTSCPAVIPDWVAPDSVSYRENQPQCAEWRASIIEMIANDPDIDVVVAASFGRRYAAGGEETTAEMARSLRDTWLQWTEAGKPVVVVGDWPVTQDFVVRCAEGQNPAEECSTDASVAEALEPMAASVALAGSPAVTSFDATEAMCDAERCYAVIGGLLVYRDWHHLTPAFAWSLGPYLTPVLDEALAEATRGRLGR